jgi:hypothetical protein
MSRTFNYFVEEESSTVAGGQGSEDEDGNTDSKGVALTEKQRKQQKGNNILFIVCLYLYCRCDLLDPINQEDQTRITKIS